MRRRDRAHQDRRCSAILISPQAPQHGTRNRTSEEATMLVSTAASHQSAPRPDIPEGLIAKLGRTLTTDGRLPQGTPPAVPERAPARQEAAALLSQLVDEGLIDEPEASSRLAAICGELDRAGTYRQSERELLHGSRIAWRNNTQCIGKFYWKALQVRDVRDLGPQSAEADIFEALVEHQRTAWNGGKIQLVLSPFAPSEPDRPGVHVWNTQLVRYAGYRQASGSILGDPESVAFTEAVRALGWCGRGTAFDVLPIVVQQPGKEPKYFELPPDAAPEVSIRHPSYPWFEKLGLRWLAFPSISNQSLLLGGLTYTLAPFSAWYTCTEIGARNLSDTNRYDMLSAVAQGMGLDVRCDRSLWRDRALVELVAAVLYSFDEAGVNIIDHHFATKQFVRHEERERKSGRDCPADWSLIVPATSGSTTPVWQRRYDNVVRMPNFAGQEPVWASQVLPA
jgi:nitric-oxide synthase